MDIVQDGPTLQLAGDFDVRSTTEVREALHERLDIYDQVVVDLTGVTSTDLTALRLLAAASHTAERRGQRVTLRGAGPMVRRMLAKSHLIRIVELDRTPAVV